MPVVENRRSREVLSNFFYFYQGVLVASLVIGIAVSWLPRSFRVTEQQQGLTNPINLPETKTPLLTNFVLLQWRLLF